MKRLALFFLFLLLIFNAEAQLKIASVLSNHMVLQRNADVKLWGKAKAGEKVTVSVDWNAKKFTTNSDSNGKWLLKVPTTNAGGPYQIKVSAGKEQIMISDVLLGEVWLGSGQSNMSFAMCGYKDQPVNGASDFLADADNDQIRMFGIPNDSKAEPQDFCGGIWVAANAESVSTFSAVAYLFAKQLQQKLKVPVGILHASWGGSWLESWMNKDAIAGFPQAIERSTLEKSESNQRASQLYNAMIAPIKNFSIKGAIWYQGESNVARYPDYADLMAAMVWGWRAEFEQGDFPFYYVEIAPYDYGKDVNSAFLREQQTKAILMIPNSGMVCTIDLGEEKCVHPAEKFTISKRLSWYAFAETYGLKGILCRTPLYQSSEVKDTLMLVSFQNAENGLTTFGRKLESVEIAGVDRVFYPANAVISEKKLKVWSPKVKQPVAVRYAFCNFPKGEGFLYNVLGLPVSSFRTDNWEK